jgi:hypothetical protein
MVVQNKVPINIQIGIKLLCVAVIPKTDTMYVGEMKKLIGYLL